MTERTIPAATRREIDREDSGDPILVFLTIAHPSLVDPIRVVSDPFNFMLGGAEHIGFEFRIRLVSDTEEAPFAELEIQNVDLTIGRVLRSIVTPPNLTVEVISAAEFDLTADPRTELATATRIYTATNLDLANVEMDAMMIRGRLVSRNYSQELWPGTMATRERLPGLFR